MADVARIKDNISSMIAQGAPESDIDQYLHGEGVTPEQLRATPQEGHSTLDSYVRSIANGMTFGLADRFAAGMGSLTGIGGNQGDYAGNLKSEQAKTDQFAAEHPIGNLGAQGAGALATFPAGMAARAIQGASMGAKVLGGAGLGAGLGGAQGALSSRDWTDVPQTIKDAAFGAGTGAGLGAAFPVVGAGIGAAYNGISNALRSSPGISRGAAPHLLEAYKADTAPAIQSELDRLGPNATLADAGPALLGKAQGASLNSDEGRSILQSALTARNEGTNQRISSDVNRALGPAEDPQTVTNAIKDYRSKVDNAAYPAALDSAPEVKVAPMLRQIDDMIPRSVGMEKKALTHLRDMMTTTEKRPLLDSEGFPQYDSLGRQKYQDVKVSQNDANVLHKVKQELDNVIQYDAPGLGVPAGALTRQQGTLKLMRGQLNNALETQVPGYRQANAASAALAKRADAVEAGTQYLGAGKTTPSPDRFAAEFNPLSQGEKIAFAKGSRGNIERQLGTKANDLQALRSELQGEGGWNTAKLATVHGQDAADQLIGSVERNLKFRDTHNKIVENSQTAQRQAAARSMKPEPSSETPLLNPNMSLTGLAATGAKKIAGATFNALLRKDPTKAFGEVAKVLSAQGPQRDTYHRALVDALNRRATNAAASSKVGNAAALTALAVANGYLRGRSNAPRNSN